MVKIQWRIQVRDPAPPDYYTKLRPEELSLSQGLDDRPTLPLPLSEGLAPPLKPVSALRQRKSRGNQHKKF